jgi:hypothetical protein
MATFEELTAWLNEFVAFHERGGMRQRGDEWYAAMASTVGGSEMAAIMGLSSYAGFYDVVLSKVAIRRGESGFAGGEACWWGTLFEDAVADYVAADLGAPVVGDAICIRAVEGHRNSPDGYIVVRVLTDEQGEERLWTTADAADMHRTVPRVALLEFKSPASRKPTGSIPRQYVPQVLSGLAVSPIAQFGIFVDAVFRKCSIFDLGDTPDYDEDYHARDAKRDWSLPVAWGIIGVYAPAVDAPRHIRLGWAAEEWKEGDPSSDGADADASLAAWEINSEYFRERCRRDAPEAADLGEVAPKVFSRALRLIDRKAFKVRRVGPCFADGRGAPLKPGRQVERAVEGLRREAPAGFWLMGVIPWKLFDVSYVPVPRKHNFMEDAKPMIDRVHATVAEAMLAPDPVAFVNARRRAEAPAKRPCVAGHELQSFFDDIT